LEGCALCVIMALHLWLVLAAAEHAITASLTTLIHWRPWPSFVAQWRPRRHGGGPSAGYATANDARSCRHVDRWRRARQVLPRRFRSSALARFNPKATIGLLAAADTL